jgi:hypothetical protein
MLVGVTISSALLQAAWSDVEHELPTARIHRWPHASHCLFRTRPADVLRETAACVSGLAN